MKKIKVMIVDDHELVREGLKQVLSLEDDIEVIAETDSGLNCLRLLKECSPDIIFMDIRMPGINGIETTRLVCQEYPMAKIIMLTIYDEDKHVMDAIQAGAKGYVLKKVKRHRLIKIIHNVMNNQAFLDPKVTESIFKKIVCKDPPLKGERKIMLTRRELEILKYLVDGYKDQQIAESLFISINTVRTHLKSIYKKFGVGSKTQAVAKAVREGIIRSS